MGKIFLYAIFHANLKFSSIPSSHYSIILDRCYWPLLELAYKNDIKLGVEFSAFTLEAIDRIDSTFIKELTKCCEEGKCDFIGSGYIQAAFPIIPFEVNQKNLQIGNQIYRSLLGKSPQIAYLNEQIYSAGLVSLYREAGYHTIIMDWDNSAAYNGMPHEYLYSPQSILGNDKSKLQLLWNSSISFQKFQQCVFDEITLDEYVDYLESMCDKDTDRVFPIYGSDLEIFDYKPHFADPRHFLRPPNDFLRIKEIFQRINSMDNLKLITPSEVLSKSKPKYEVQIETPSYPIPCKKQERYNISRWAVCGRDNVKINTQCYFFYNRLKGLTNLSNKFDLHHKHKTKLERLWKDLCYLWASDFRTFTTDEKYLLFRNKMGDALKTLEDFQNKLIDDMTAQFKNTIISPLNFRTRKGFFTVHLKHDTHNNDERIQINIGGRPISSQIDEIEYYRDGRIRSSYMMIQPDIAPLSVNEATFVKNDNRAALPYFEILEDKNTIITPNVFLKLSPKRGATIENLTFPKISPKRMIFRLPHGFFGSIRLSDGAYSGDMILYDKSGALITDLKDVQIKYPTELERINIYIPIYAKVMTPLGDFWKTYRIYINEPRIDLVYHFQLKPVNPFYFRIGNFVIDPKTFDRSSLFYATTNGGHNTEQFFLNGKQVTHDRPVDLTVSTHQSLGATEGWTTVGDRKIAVSFITDKGELYSVPLIRYEEFQDIYFLRISHSIGEADETSHNFWQGHNQISFTIMAHKNHHEEIRQTSEMINNGLIWTQR
jgi:hypothetical protein